MVVEALAEVDFSSEEDQRHESLRNLRDLTPAQLMEWSVPSVELSVLGLVRHMTEMEHVFLAWGLAGGEQRLRYGDDGLRRRLGRDEEDLRWYFGEVGKVDAAIATIESLDTPGKGTPNLCDPASWR